MFGRKATTDQSQALAFAQVLSQARGQLVFLPAEAGLSGGFSVWSGLVTAIHDTGVCRVVHVLTIDGSSSRISTSMTRERIEAILSDNK